jgi:1,4-dihydroxy-2-naphthoate octaprenyltransferase
MNFAMWGKALRVIPRLNKDEWDGLDLISRWLIATRSAVLIMTFISTGIAGLLALRDGQFDIGLWLLLAIGLLMAHATNNLLNDLTDYLKGVDQDNYFRTQYGPQPVAQGLMSKRELLLYATVTGLIALLAGAYLVYLRGPLAWGLLGLGAFFVLFYTWPLKYIGLGEVAVLIVWGPLMIGGGYFILTGVWRWDVVIASLPYALGVTMVIFGKHIDKFDADKEKGIHTLPVLLGERTARYVAIAMMILQYVAVGYLISAGYFSPVLLIVLIALTAFALALAVYLKPRPAAPPENYPAGVWPLWYVTLAFFHNRRFGLLFLLGLVIDITLRSMGWFG